MFNFSFVRFSGYGFRGYGLAGVRAGEGKQAYPFGVDCSFKAPATQAGAFFYADPLSPPSEPRTDEEKEGNLP